MSSSKMKVSLQGESKKQSDQKLFWHFGLTAYGCPEKPDGHVHLRVREFVGSRKQILQYTAPPVTPADAELDGATNSAHGVRVGLWVGMWVEDAQNYRTKGGAGGKVAAAKAKETRNKSVQDVIKGGSITVIKPDPNALRVVADVNAQNTRLYRLANPDQSGLCQGIRVNIEEIWWAPEYRDDNETRIEQRRQKWPNKVQQYLDALLVRNSERTARPSKYTQLTPPNTLANTAREVAALTSDYRIKPSSNVLRQILERLRQLDPDLDARKDPAILKLVYRQIPISTLLYFKNVEL